MRRPLAAVFALVLLTAGCGSSDEGGKAPEKVKVGMFLISSAPLFTQIQEGFKQGFLAEAGLKPDQVEWVERNAEGNAGSIQTIARQFADSDVEMVEVLGTPAVLALAKLKPDFPIVAVAMGDPVGAGLAASLEAPGGQVTGSIDFIEPAKLLDQMVQVQPAFTTLGTIYKPSNTNSKVWVDQLRQAVAAHPGIKLVEASVNGSADVPAAARSLEGRADAILIGPDADVQTGLPAVGKAAASAGQQLYLVGGDVEQPGVLATLGPDYPQLGVLGGQVAAKVHLGAAPGEVPFAQPGEVTWAVNPETVKALELTLPAGAAQ
ncbi:ABC transporter substrate-binding protein [Actinocorallia herbida]|nr:ABC transporter substrate-binding protein [Actinocorallia herbida]